ncbi:MAG: GNAT family N-acetyltransferase [Desulfobacterales bacterium]|jgi:ribosomal protein S18 acetylase RimI-like enzyme
MSKSAIAYHEQPPPAIGYGRLFETTGWNKSYQASPEELHQAISDSWYVLSAYENHRLVGFGRIISDGVLYALICDLIVNPSCQGQGIGSTLLDKLIAHCRSRGIRIIWLFAAKGKSAFYKKFGFRKRPTDAPGMQMTPSVD